MKGTKVQTLGAYHSSYLCAYTKIEELEEYMSVYGWKRTLHALTETFRQS